MSDPLLPLVLLVNVAVEEVPLAVEPLDASPVEFVAVLAAPAVPATIAGSSPPPQATSAALASAAVNANVPRLGSASPRPQLVSPV